ncbi:MAG: DNA ligase [Escherichia phage RP3]|uniref:DNA ligase n=1 Tax=Escherichia phage RP3 TaxID=2867296 RepID=A0ABY3TBN6_9CAUD|nr:MAG: DNA ligase [Escherichia phage RP3]
MTILYKQNKDGSFNVWSCVAVGDKVITTYGKENGKMMFEEYTAEPKNIGKKNERNAEQQALFEVAAKYKKQVDRKGYAYTKESAQNTEKIGVQLAHDAAKVSHAKYLKFPADAQPKLDGVRCRISRHLSIGSVFTAYSRENTVYKIPTELIPDIMAMLRLHKDVDEFDGEIYAHGWDLEDIVSMIKNEDNPDRHLLKFYWYDICDSTKTWPERRDIIETSPLNDFRDGCKVVPVKSRRGNYWVEFF